MLASKRFAYSVLVVGILLALLSILIDPLRGLDIYMATSQIVILVIGLIVAVAGAYLAFLYKPSI